MKEWKLCEPVKDFQLSKRCNNTNVLVGWWGVMRSNATVRHSTGDS